MNTQALAEKADSAAVPLGARPSVLFVSRKWAPAIGGMETYCIKLSTQLEKHARVETVVLPGKPDGGAPGLGSVLLFGLRASASIVFRRAAPDIVHITDMSSWPLATVARLRSGRSTVVLSAHGTDVSFSDRSGVVPWAYGLYMRLGGVLNGGCKVLANSRATAKKAQALGFSLTETIPLATDMQSALDHRAPRSGPRKILFAGRLIEPKGCRWFIENVLPELPGDVRLEVAGTVWDPREEEALSHPKVDFLGALAPEALARRYADADCVVVPNIQIGGVGFEGFGLVAAEAAAAGGLVLASAHTGLEDAVLDGETGLKLPMGQAQAWIEAVTDVLDWPEDKRAAFLDRSVAAAGRHYSWQRVGDATFRAYATGP